jgi:hypothetical protein
MQWPTSLPEFVNVAAQAQIRDVVAKHLIAFVVTSVYICYDMTYNDGERPAVQSWDSTAFPSVWMMWQAWQSNVQNNIMHHLHSCFCMSAQQWVLGYSVFLVALTRTHVGKVARALLAFLCILLAKFCFMRYVDKCEDCPSFTIVYFVLVVVAYLGETPHYACCAAALVMQLLLCSQILANKQGWVRYFVLSLGLLRVVELLQPPLHMQPRIDRLFKTLEFVLLCVTFVATCALAILFGIADVLKSLYSRTIAIYNTFMPTPTLLALSADDTGSSRARSRSPALHQQMSRAAVPQMSRAALPRSALSAAPLRSSSISRVDSSMTLRDRNQPSRNITANIAVQHNEVFDVPSFSRKRSRIVNKTAPAKRSKRR